MAYIALKLGGVQGVLQLQEVREVGRTVWFLVLVGFIFHLENRKNAHQHSRFSREFSTHMISLRFASTKRFICSRSLRFYSLICAALSEAGVQILKKYRKTV